VVVHSSAQLVKHPVVVVWLQLLVGVVVSFDVLFDVCWVWVDFGTLQVLPFLVWVYYHDQ